MDISLLFFPEYHLFLFSVFHYSGPISQHSHSSLYLTKLKAILVVYSWLKLWLLMNTSAHLSSEGWKASVLPRCWGSHTHSFTNTQTRAQKTSNISASAGHADCVICSEHKGMLREAGQGAGVQNGGVLRECMLEKFKGRFSYSINRKYQRSVHTEPSRESNACAALYWWRKHTNEINPTALFLFDCLDYTYANV